MCRILCLFIPIILIIIGELLKDSWKSLIHNLTYNPAFDGILVLSFFIFIAWLKWKAYKHKIIISKTDFIKENNINIIQEWFLEKLIDDDIKKDEDNSDFFKGNKDEPIENLEPNKYIQQQMQKAKLNTYNNSYLTFCLLIDRCKTIKFKENNDYQNNEKPYCFPEIAEAFELDWKGRRYLHYIAHSLLGTIGGLLEEHNKNEEKDENKIPCVNATIVKKWERDTRNKWCCNGGIKSPDWCCYPKYRQDGEDDRKFILELCEIVKKEDDETIKNWKEKYYNLLKEKEKDKSMLEQKSLDDIYDKYKKEGKKMNYEELDKKAEEEKNNK